MPITQTWLDTRYFLSDESKTMEVDGLGFKGTLKKNFPDCESLYKKLKSKELRYNAIEQVVEEGNRCL